MSNAGKLIKQYLEKRQISIAELARLSKLPQSKVDNIIYGRSKNKDAITKIAKSLNIPADYLLIAPSSKFDHALYHLSFDIAYQALLEERVEMTKTIIDEIANDAFIFSKQNSTKDKKEIAAYVKGIIFYRLKENTLKKV
ncbi:MAG: helix-turn-helix transcriptional regulator [Rickettsiales bacterium]